jgi:hypothetical protein
MTTKFQIKQLAQALSMTIGGSLLLATTAHAGIVRDGHGNVAYTTAAECDNAVNNGTARFYESYTHKPALKRAGEVDVKVMRLGQVDGYAKGACDLGVGHSYDRDGVAPALIGKFVPFSPDMKVNVYTDAQGKPLRISMQQCDNNFSGPMPRPIAVHSASACYADVLIPAQFKSETESVVQIPETSRFEVVPPTYKTVTEQVMVRPEIRKQIPIPATYKTVTETVLVQPDSEREEPIPATYKTVTEQVMVQSESTRLETTPATYKTVTEQVMVKPESKKITVVPAVYEEREESVVDRPATTRVVTTPPTFKTVSERVLAKPEAVAYEPIDLPLRKVTEQKLLAEGNNQIVATSATFKTVSERVLVKEASTRLVAVPAVFETVTERVKVADAHQEWKRGRAWIGQAINVRPLRSFAIGQDGKVEGIKVAPGWDRAADNRNLDDDVMCLVAVPERFETVQRRVLKTPATVREEVVPAQYAEVKRQVIDREASTQVTELPAQYQNVTRQVIDVEKLRAAGYRFNDQGDLQAMPTGERILRAAQVAGSGAQSAGAASGQEGYVREIKLAAVYEVVSRKVIDQPAGVKEIEVPATYKIVKSRVVTKPAATQETVVPAVYETVTRQVVDQPASSQAFTVPAQYTTIERQVVDQPASTRKIPVPAVYQQVSRRVVDTPASFREEVIPAVFQTISNKVVDKPATTTAITVPAKYTTLTRQVKVSDARTERRQILCETNATPAKIQQIQRALRNAGYNPGPIDGVMRAQTMRAVNGYQQAKQLPVDGYLNLDTVKSLGVSPE